MHYSHYLSLLQSLGYLRHSHIQWRDAIQDKLHQTQTVTYTLQYTHRNVGELLTQGYKVQFFEGNGWSITLARGRIKGQEERRCRLLIGLHSRAVHRVHKFHVRSKKSCTKWTTGTMLHRKLWRLCFRGTERLLMPVNYVRKQPTSVSIYVRDTVCFATVCGWLRRHQSIRNKRLSLACFSTIHDRIWIMAEIRANFTDSLQTKS